MTTVKPKKTADTTAITETSAVTKAKPAAQGVTIRLSLAETIHLPYRPTSFKVRDMRRVIADVKRAQE